MSRQVILKRLAHPLFREVIKEASPRERIAAGVVLGGALIFLLLGTIAWVAAVLSLVKWYLLGRA